VVCVKSGGKMVHKHGIANTCLALGLAATGAFGQTVWVSTATQGMSLSNAVDLGALPAQSPLKVVVSLGLRNVAGLKQLVAGMNDPNSPLYGTELTPNQFTASYGPTSDQVSAVIGYLGSQGFTNVQAEPNNLLVTADGTAAAASAAFNTTIKQFSLNGETVYANVSAAQVPASLGGIVTAVLGLNTANKMMPGGNPTGIKICGPIGSVVCPVSFYTPNDYWLAYDAGATPTGSKTTIAIFASGDVTGVISDLRVAENVNKLPQVPVVVRQVGLASPPNGTDEWALDTQMSTGMAGAVQTLYIYTATHLFDSDVALMFNKFVTDNVARAGSASFGLCEAFAWADGSMLVDDMIFLQGAAQGQTVFASTGDQGSACPVTGATNGVPLSGVPGAVLYPASSAYVVAVGGTTLFTDSSGNYVKEAGWDAGGGGISAFENCPFWMSAGTVPSCNAGARGLPDVAMDADLVSGGLVYIGCPPNDPNPKADCEFIVGGTSLSAPLALGVWARLQSARNNKLGYASPKLYSLYQAGPPPVSPGYHDVVGGCNGAYCAIPGWDYVTGLGSFDITKILALLHK
jgi:pseudomonalisin